MPGPGEPHQYREVAESFGSDAARYDRARPSYPDALVDRILTVSPGRDSWTSAAGPASPPGCSRRQAARCSGSIPTGGWPSWPGAAGSTSRWPRSRPGIQRPAVRRGHRRAGLALGGPGGGRGQGGPGAAPRRAAGRVLELVPAPARAERGDGRGLPPDRAGHAGRTPRAARPGRLLGAVREGGRRDAPGGRVRRAGAVAHRLGAALQPRRMAGSGADVRRLSASCPRPRGRSCWRASAPRSTRSGAASRWGTPRWRPARHGSDARPHPAGG